MENWKDQEKLVYLLTNPRHLLRKVALNSFRKTHYICGFIIYIHPKTIKNKITTILITTKGTKMKKKRFKQDLRWKKGTDDNMYFSLKSALHLLAQLFDVSQSLRC